MKMISLSMEIIFLLNVKFSPLLIVSKSLVMKNEFVGKMLNTNVMRLCSKNLNFMLITIHKKYTIRNAINKLRKFKYRLQKKLFLNIFFLNLHEVDSNQNSKG